MAKNPTQQTLSEAPRLPNYQIIDVVGQGGMAKVYKAMQNNLYRVVAIKELRANKAAEITTIKRFDREAIAASSLSHENVISIYDYFEFDNKRYLVMEYVGGCDLATIIKHSRKMPTHIATMIMLQVVRALEYAHAMGLVHRDVKPGNIMVSNTGQVKLMDFGVVQTKGAEAITLPGTFVGTPRYMSPEQITGNVTDFRSDMFSIGVVFYELITGKRLFDATDNQQIFHQVLQRRIANPSRLRPGTSPLLAKIILTCLKREVRKRFRTTQELRRRLEGVLGNQQMVRMRQDIQEYLIAQEIVERKETEISVTGSPVVPSPSWRERLFAHFVGPEGQGFFRGYLATLAVALILAVFVWWQNPSTEEPSPANRFAGLKVIAKPWGIIYVNGEFREVTPYDQPIILRSGYHKISIEHPKLGSKQYSLPLSRGEVSTLAVDFNSFNKQEKK